MLGRVIGRAAVGLLLAGVVAGATRVAAADALRVGVIADGGEVAALQGDLKAALEKVAGVPCVVIPAGRDASGGLALEPLRAAQAIVFAHGPGKLDERGRSMLRDLVAGGRGCVVLGATREAWAAWPEFLDTVLGATPGDRFAGGAPMTVINLFPHPIFAGVSRLETPQAMTSFTKLVDDAQMIMEGTVGEATTPLAWVRRLPSGRLCHIVPADAELWRDPSYQRLVANAVVWTSGRPVPGATAAVQRTFMPDAYPGAFAITLPNGPGVCLDPVRGGINYIWDGDFVDLRPRWLTKQGEPARISGAVFYQEKGWQPLRLGAPNSEPDFHFRGYEMKAGLPEFHYVINGRDVYETISASTTGTGILRRFRVGPGSHPLWINLEPQTGADVVLRGLENDGAAACFTARDGGEFTIEIRRRTGGITP